MFFWSVITIFPYRTVLKEGIRVTPFHCYSQICKGFTRDQVRDVLEESYLSIFFIKVWRLSKRRYLECQICKSELDQ